MTSTLFDPIVFHDHTIRNRVWVAPMCQYSSEDDGLPTPWHHMHYGQFAAGGAGLVMLEATAVSPQGRITPSDLGIWSDEQAAALAPIAAFIAEHGASPAIQLAHAGRKASTYGPFSTKNGSVPVGEGGWETIGPSAVAFGSESGLPVDRQLAVPREMTSADIATVIEDFANAADRSVRAGFTVLEVHAAHGYLLHEFLSPISNQRTDQYGGSVENRSRLTVEIVEAIRARHPQVPLFVRISATDWVDGGYTLEEATVTSRLLKAAGADLIDVSTGGNVARAPIATGPGYQIPHAAHIKKEAGVQVSGVGAITDARQADGYLRDGLVDATMLARHMLRDPHFALRAADELGVTLDYWPVQYERAQGFPTA
ncbi:NADH:flavin oxidoreductase/NADH oxidase [Jonesia quinghaiensis]|uniref:NADH:flavin oxidoreductase/NADH oxidase n=1 Tax=Jonesia quinghaiensis TaxID=262806 RepID=UPI000491228A|nr:NADH:flavin oxidoreductase/NADH oxidase [Jonesia quinghaiensis]